MRQDVCCKFMNEPFIHISSFPSTWIASIPHRLLPEDYLARCPFSCRSRRVGWVDVQLWLGRRSPLLRQMVQEWVSTRLITAKSFYVTHVIPASSISCNISLFHSSNAVPYISQNSVFHCHKLIPRISQKEQYEGSNCNVHFHSRVFL